MSVGLPSDEVAEDYKNSLEDLTLNSRYEISNLTVIAKENTEHAMAISRVLENHIRNTPPDRKLPALYVLDSVVKNVGTPYTLFLGRNLYTIYMGAYSQVNPNVRRKLDEMLKTWKEPVPGSLDPRPVFPAETIRPIESALIKARTSAIHQQQEQQNRNQQEMMARQRSMAAPNTQWRNTPTPPQTNSRYFPPPQQQGYMQHPVPNGHYQPHSPYPPHTQYPSLPHVPQTYQQPHQRPTSYPQPPTVPQHLDSLNRDIAELVRSTREQLVSSVYDPGLQGRLKALLDLQTLMSQQQLPPDQLQAVRDQITGLSTPLPYPSAKPQYIPPPQTHQQQPLPSHQRPLQIPPPRTADLNSFLPSNNLAEIIAKANRPPVTPPTPLGLLPQSQPTSAAHSSATPSLPVDLLATLRAKGLLPVDSNTPPNASLGFEPPSSVTHTPPILSASLVRPTLINDVELTPVSLKRPRTHLISTLYDARPNQCSTCGRRFLTTVEGREKKARHLDWHFRTNQRLADSAKRGQSRSWYVDELEWIKSRDNPEDAPITDASTAATKAALAASLAAADPKNKHIPVPSDPALANFPCPICQEKFDTTWNDEVQDFVWMDAIQFGSRVFHASCHAEVKKDGGSTPLRTGTPDSVLGKRKAGVPDINANNAKVVKA